MSKNHVKNHIFALAHNLTLDLLLKKRRFSDSKIVWEDFALLQTFTYTLTPNKSFLIFKDHSHIDLSHA